jgi:hypothetical protein
LEQIRPILEKRSNQRIKFFFGKIIGGAQPDDSPINPSSDRTSGKEHVAAMGSSNKLNNSLPRI